MKEILQKLRESDAKTIRQVYTENYSTCKLPIVTDGGTEEDAQTIYNDVFVYFLNRLDTEGFELRSTINAYLRNACKYAWWRETKHRRKLSNLIEAQKEFYRLFYDPNEDYISEKKVLDKYYEQMDDCLGKLGEKCKRLLNLTYFKGLSDKEIAPKMKYKLNYVRVARANCIRKVKNCIQLNQNQEL